MQLQTSDLEDDILIELHLEDEWVKVMWWFCIRCDCQLGAVILRNSKEFWCGETIFAAVHQGPHFVSFESLAWLRLSATGWQRAHELTYLWARRQAARWSGILAWCCSVCYQTTKNSLQHLFYTDGQDMGTQWSAMLSVDRTGCQYRVLSVKEHLSSQSVK